MNAYVVVEGALEVDLLKRLLPKELLAVVPLVPSGGPHSLISLARSLLITRQKPVAVLVDTDSVEEAAVRERRRSAEDLMEMVSPGVPFKVILLIPTTEILFFQAPDLFRKVFPGEGSAERLLLARDNPKEALSQLSARAGGPRRVKALVKALGDRDLEALRSAGPIRELIAFLEEVAAPQTQPILK